MLTGATPLKMLRENRYFFNPLNFYFANYLYQSISAPIAFIQFAPGLVNMQSYIYTFSISMLYLILTIFGFNFSHKLLQKSVFNFFSMCALQYDRSMSKFQIKSASILCFVLFIVFYTILAITSGAGLLWITDSRLSYSVSREAVGIYWIISAAFLKLSYIFTINDRLKNDEFSTSSLIWKTLFFAFISYFLGSKGIILGFILIGVGYYNYYVSPLKARTVMTYGIILMVSFSLLQMLQGSAADAVESLLYADYFQNTSEFLRRFDADFGFKWGEVFISSFWGIVPRAIYPNKPYEYGFLLIHQVMFPGAAQEGYTPGMLPWVGEYLDFGLAGVAVSGFFKGLLMGWVNNYFLFKNKSIVGFIMILQICLISPVYIMIPDYMFLLLIMPVFSRFMYFLDPLPSKTSDY